MPTGLGDEQLWLSPTNSNNVSPFDDQSGNGNNGTASGGLLTIADSSNGGSYAYDFDGTDDYVSIPDSPSLRIDNPSGISICAWIKPDTVSGGDSFSSTNPRYIIKKGVLPDSFNYGLRLLGGKVSFTYRNSTDTAYTACIQDVASVVAGSWQHVAVSGSSSGYKIYVNGSEVASTQSGTLTDSPIQNSNSCELGRQDTTQRMFDGLQDDIRLYDRVLTPAEIVHLAEARGIEGPAPVGLGDEKLWLCPSINDSANDISGNGNNGSYQGGMGTVADDSNGGSYAYEFDGVDDCITNSSLDLRNLSAMSWSAWVKDDKTSGLSTFFSHGKSGEYTNDTLFYQNAGDNRFQVNQTADGSGYTPKPTTSTWNHLAVVFDGSGASSSDRLRYFVNGVETSLAYDYLVPTATGNPSTSSTMIGNYVSAPTNFLLGRMDDIRVYDRALAQPEITYLATSRGIEGGPDTPPAGGFYNPFLSHTFHTLIGQRIR